ncbi:hypothetical protein BMW23_1068 [Bodo saltans virus]|uniref:Uncharacterized protein n=1 Tax=Bodo saltans virus TaxID=2024608 RepID=A0A2H4UVZ5_9VIRU|nr:hypothetical protein QJ851_gp1049 [Bodo saltans virus]ATZ81112.1 hypothetical protein BMW23_1068 [Bodo saltans virus]
MSNISDSQKSIFKKKSEYSQNSDNNMKSERELLNESNISSTSSNTKSETQKTVNSEHEVKIAYKLLKNEMKSLEKKMNDTILTKYDIARINFILKSLEALDKLRKKD